MEKEENQTIEEKAPKAVNLEAQDSSESSEDDFLGDLSGLNLPQESYENEESEESLRKKLKPQRLTKHQKKMIKLHKWDQDDPALQEIKREKRFQERQKKKEKMRQFKQEMKEKGVDMTTRVTALEYKNPKSRNFRKILRQKIEKAPVIIIDCAFSEHHSLRDEKSLVRQLSHMLGRNRKFEKPLKIVLTGVSERLLGLMRTNDGDKWLLGGIEHQCYLEVAQKYLNMEDENSYVTDWKERLIYLTGDANEEMEGICEENKQ